MERTPPTPVKALELDAISAGTKLRFTKTATVFEAGDIIEVVRVFHGPLLGDFTIQFTENGRQGEIEYYAYRDVLEIVA